MAPKLFCQSCTMPIDNDADKGNEKDGSKSNLYCRYCYVDGSFINLSTTIEQMKNIVVTQMQKNHIPDFIIQQSLHMLPHLKRWKVNSEI